MPDRIPMHKLFLLPGLILLGIGSYGIVNYFHLKGPPAAQLHELLLQDVTRVTPESEIPGSSRIDSIWLQTAKGDRIRYRKRFPYSDQVLVLDTNYSLLLDSSNHVWAVKTGDGQVRSQRYFEEYNIEAKTVGKICGPFLATFGALLSFGYFLGERAWPEAPAAERAKLEVDANRTRLVVALIGYLIIFGTVLGPWLRKYLPGFVVQLLWLASCGVLVGVLSKKPPPKP